MEAALDRPLTASPGRGLNRADLHLIVRSHNKDDGSLGSVLDGALGDQDDTGSHGTQNAEFHELSWEQDTVRVGKHHAEVSGAGGRTHTDFEQIKLAFMGIGTAVRKGDDTAQ